MMNAWHVLYHGADADADDVAVWSVAASCHIMPHATPYDGMWQ